MKSKDLLSVADLNRKELLQLLASASEMKRNDPGPVLKGKTLAMIFEKPSLRTKVSFDVAMYQLGGHALYLSKEEVGLGKREPISDVAQVLSRYVDIIMARVFAHKSVVDLARYATVPVINGLSDTEHPCQIVGDLLTIREKKGKLEGLNVVYISDGNNVAASLLLGCALVGAHFKIACPEGYEIPKEIMETAKKIRAAKSQKIVTLRSPEEALAGADVVYTDVWTSMGQEAESQERHEIFKAYQITAELLAKAKADAILMHPMPVHYGEEFAEGMTESPQSVLIDQAENRLHAQKAILVELAGKGRV